MIEIIYVYGVITQWFTSLCDKIVVSKIEKLICNVSGKENIL